jgi:outer membrane immunogenic protein
MKRLLLAAVGVGAVAVGSALAADLPSGFSPRGPAYVPFFTWNGFYLGLNAGYGFGRTDWTDTVTLVSTGNFNVTGALVGGTAGYNMQFGGWVLGVEADVGWSNIKGSTTTNCLGTCQTSNDWLGTARGRAGYAFDRFLPYITGGAAFGGVKANVTGFGNFSDTGVGWAGGGGIEYAFANNWTAKIEYLYVDLGKTTCNATCSGTNPFNVTFTSNIVRGGVNYRF